MMQPSRRPRVAIESPYAGNVQVNKRFALKACRYAFGQGLNPFAMHLFFPLFLDENLTEERSAGIECGLAWTEFAEEVWFCLRSGESLTPGMRKALERLSDPRYANVVKRELTFTDDGEQLLESRIVAASNGADVAQGERKPRTAIARLED